MAYVKTVYVNDSTPAISADNLNKIENGLETLDNSQYDSNLSIVDDESTIGVHRSAILTNNSLVAFSIPQNTEIKIYTISGENLPSNRLKIYDSNGDYIDFFGLESSYGKSRTANYTKQNGAFVSLLSDYAKGIRVVWYDSKTIGTDVNNLLSDVSELQLSDSEVNQTVLNEFYNYGRWANVGWSRNNTGDRHPTKSNNANRASFSELLFVKAGAKIHIEAFSGRKYGCSAWTYSNGMWTNTRWDSSWQLNSQDWFISEDSYINVAVANSTDTTPISINNVGVVVSIYDSVLYEHEKRLVELEKDIPAKFKTEMETSIESVRECLTEPCLVFPLITDIHYAPNTQIYQNFDDFITLVKEFKDNVKCDFLANLGDNINGNSDQNLMISYADYMLSQFIQVGLPFYFCMGNHDTNYDPSPKFDIEQTYRAFMSATKDVVMNKASNGTDFYKDFDDLGIRVIFLNTQYLNAYFISDDTVTWFENVALNTDKIVVLCTHQGILSNQTYANRIPYNADDIESAINSFISGGGTLIQLFGHSHADYTFVEPWLALGLTCGKFESVDTSAAGYTAITGYTGSLISPTRTTGDETEQAWNIVIVRPTIRKINIIRFGAGSDREFAF